MSDVIKLLPDNIANQIAAGEVIQRPASVVKELVENAIDAGATKIDVNIKEAGKTLIQVVDNGKGMSPSDAILCFERHATSKVQSAADLFALSTKGFRGEALASVCAIAHVEMRTRQEESQTGYFVKIEGSEVVNKEEVVCSVGTSFEIKNLFFNVPARRNFLKKESTEFKHIQDEFERVVLAHPNIAFTLTNNGNVVYNLQSEILRKRIVNILGKNTNEQLVPIEENTDIVKVKGYVLKPESARKTRGDQFFFVNDRYFKSTYFNHAINKAFDGLIKDRSFPGYFIYLEVDPSKIDVNVHPTKTEIKFEEDKFIYAILFSSIKQALGKYNIVPTLDFEAETSFDIPHSMRSQPVVEPTITVDNDYNPFVTNNRSSSSTSSVGSTKSSGSSSALNAQGFGSNNAPSDWQNFYKIEDESESDETQDEIFEQEQNIEQNNILLQGSYLISSVKSGLMMINWRRATERIVYDELSAKFVIQPLESQQLLFPIEVSVSRRECALWMENAPILKQMGFLGDVDGQQITIHAIPSALQEESVVKAVEEIMEGLSNDALEKGDIAHMIISSVSSAAGMKKHNLSTLQAKTGLIEQLFQCSDHVNSPRNKKIISNISLEEIKQKFI